MRPAYHRPMSLPGSPDAVLLDLDGVLYIEDEPIEGAVDAVAALRDAGLVLRFVTNTTAPSRAQTLERLRRIGVPLEDDELVTPALLARATAPSAATGASRS